MWYLARCSLACRSASSCKSIRLLSQVGVSSPIPVAKQSPSHQWRKNYHDRSIKFQGKNEFANELDLNEIWRRKREAAMYRTEQGEKLEMKKQSFQKPGRKNKSLRGSTVLEGGSLIEVDCSQAITLDKVMEVFGDNSQARLDLFEKLEGRCDYVVGIATIPVSKICRPDRQSALVEYPHLHHRDGEEMVEFYVITQFALPGERVLAHITQPPRYWVQTSSFEEEARRKGIGSPKNSLTFSPVFMANALGLLPGEEANEHRVEPLCDHYQVCSGCTMQHVAYEDQLRRKTELATSIFQDCGTQDELDSWLRPTIPSPQLYNYRNKVSPHYTLGKGMEPVSIGFNSFPFTSSLPLSEDIRDGTGVECFSKTIDDNFQQQGVVDVKKCVIATEAINKAYEKMRETVSEKAKRQTRGATLVFRDSGSGDICNNHKDRLVMRTSIGPGGKAVNFLIEGNSFFQTNSVVLPRMLEYVVKEIGGPSEIDFVMDLYCGVGVFAYAAIMSGYRHVLGLEISKTAIAMALQAKNLNDLPDIEVREVSKHIGMNRFTKENHGKRLLQFKDLEADNITKDSYVTAVLRQHSPNRTCVIIDPPRKGCSSTFLEQLLSLAPRRIVYVSCYMPTQARDVKILRNGGYNIAAIQPVDQYPQTHHVENIVTLVKDL